MVELHDFNNENNNHLTWNFNKFFNLDEDEYFFPYECSLFELKKESEYIIVFIPKFNVYEDLRNVNFIKKFIFKSFDKNSYEEIKTVQYEQFLNHKIVDAFLMDDYNILVLVSYFEIEESKEIEYDGSQPPKIETRPRRLNYFNYVLNFYITNNLKALPYAKNMELDYQPAYENQNGEIFLKEIYLENKCALVILSEDGELNFHLHYIDYINNENQMILIPWGDYYYSFDYNYGSLYNFVKLNNTRIAFFYTNNFDILYILLLFKMVTLM